MRAPHVSDPVTAWVGKRGEEVFGFPVSDKSAPDGNKTEMGSAGVRNVCRAPQRYLQGRTTLAPVAACLIWDGRGRLIGCWPPFLCGL